MEVIFNPETQAKLNRAAAANNGGPAEYVQQLVENYVDHDVWIREQVLEGLGQLDRHEFLTNEEVSQRIDKLFASQ